MKKERFQSGYYVVLTVVYSFIVIFAIGYYNHRLGLDKPTLVILCVAIGMIALAFKDKSTTYLEIQDGRNLINDGYRDFGKDVVDIHAIKYIYRVPQFVVNWYGGALMVIYFRNDKGEIQHSALRERNYSNETIKKFLFRMKEIKSTIELDPEYEKFLTEDLTKNDNTKNTITIVEQRLRDKGERWSKVSGVKKIFHK